MASMALFISQLCGASTVHAESEGSGLAFYWGDFWETWTQDAKSYWSVRFPAPVSVKGKTFQTCSELVDAMQGDAITYQFQLENKVGTCIVASLAGNVRAPRSLLFDEKNISQEIYNNLDMDTMPWHLTFEDSHKHKIENITSIARQKIQKNQISFKQDETIFSINIFSLGDFKSDGSQQALAWLHLVDSKKVEDGYILLSRDNAGGPIHAEPIVLRPMAYITPAPDLKRKATLRSQ